MCIMQPSSYDVSAQAAWTLEGSLLPAAWPTTGNIQFEDYGLQYRKGLDWALNDISINIQDREKVSNDESENLHIHHKAS